MNTELERKILEMLYIMNEKIESLERKIENLEEKLREKNYETYNSYKRKRICDLI